MFSREKGRLKSTSINTETKPNEHQKSDRLIVAMKLVKTSGAKGATNQHSTEVKHAKHWRFGTHET